MAAPFSFEHSVAFSHGIAAEALAAIPALPGVFALHGPTPAAGQPAAQPYLTRAANLRRRIRRMLAPPELSADGSIVQSKRLNLSSRVARIEYTVTGSEFESSLALYHAAAQLFGLDEARRRLKLRTPFFLRFTADNAYPRVYSTNRLGKRALENFYGPFPSRASADHYCEAVLDLFKLRRCCEDLAPYPEHPGCVYQEMKKCLAPCNQACTPAGAAAYAAESDAVKRFFDTRGESMLSAIAAQREEASAAMEFERAAELHAQWQRVKAAQSLSDELVQPIPLLRAVIVQKAAGRAAPSPEESGFLSSRSEAEGPAWAPPARSASLAAAPDSAEPSAAIFLLHSGCIAGPERLSTLGVRAVREQTSVGSSLFAQPLMLQAIPLEEDAPQSTPVIPSEAKHSEAESKEPDAASISPTAAAFQSTAGAPPSGSAPLNPEARAAAVIASLEEHASAPKDLGTLSDHLSLLRRWYYRPEKQRAGEIFFPKEDKTWPIRRILNGAARAALGDPKQMAETQREAATRNPAEPELRPGRTKVLHAGRPDVERVVPVAPKRGRPRKLQSAAEDPQP